VRLIPGKAGRLRRKLVVLAPDRRHTTCFPQSTADVSLHQRLLADAQRLRGRIYLEDGAIQPSQLSADGRHVQAADEKGWHLLTLDERGRVAACTRYMPHCNNVTFSELMVSSSPLAQSETWGASFRGAIEAELALARKRRCSFAEVGGWVTSEALRGTTEAIRMILSAYGLARSLGGTLGVSTVTTRHNSSSMLRRIGLGSLLSRGAELPPYFDPHYNCEMEILRFDSERPNPRYQSWIDECQTYLATAPVICAKAGERSLEQIRVAIRERFQHTGQTSNVESSSIEPVWERSTGVA
jgi:hypothetical protein